MANMRVIRSRIRGVRSTQQITKAMKMVAVSKLRKAQGRMTAMQPFAEKSQAILDTLLSGEQQLSNPFLTARAEVKRVCYVVFLGNRGLCGVYNTALFNYLLELLHKETRPYDVLVCGRWGKDVFEHHHIPIRQMWTEISDTPSAQEGLEIAKRLKELFLSGEADEVHLVYQHYINVLRQAPRDMQLLPACPAQAREDEGPKLDYIFEPDQATILETVMQLYLNNMVSSVLLEAKCGEHSARMTAMTTATDSTKKLIDELNLSLNRARQAAITTEISEIVGGSAALNRRKS